MSDLSALFEMPLFAGLPEERRIWLCANLGEHYCGRANS
jgi:hypothetical protein